MIIYRITLKSTLKYMLDYKESFFDFDTPVNQDNTLVKLITKVLSRGRDYHFSNIDLNDNSEVIIVKLDNFKYIETVNKEEFHKAFLEAKKLIMLK